MDTAKIRQKIQVALIFRDFPNETLSQTTIEELLSTLAGQWALM
jgi:hypothetical protein